MSGSLMAVVAWVSVVLGVSEAQGQGPAATATAQPAGAPRPAWTTSSTGGGTWVPGQTPVTGTPAVNQPVAGQAADRGSAQA